MALLINWKLSGLELLFTFLRVLEHEYRAIKRKLFLILQLLFNYGGKTSLVRGAYSCVSTHAIPDSNPSHQREGS